MQFRGSLAVLQSCQILKFAWNLANLGFSSFLAFALEIHKHKPLVMIYHFFKGFPLVPLSTLWDLNSKSYASSNFPSYLHWSLPIRPWTLTNFTQLFRSWTCKNSHQNFSKDIGWQPFFWHFWQLCSLSGCRFGPFCASKSDLFGTDPISQLLTTPPGPFWNFAPVPCLHRSFAKRSLFGQKGPKSALLFGLGNGIGL